MTEGESIRLHEMNGKIGGLESTVKHLTDTWQRQDEEATAGRRRLHEKFDDLIASVAGLTFRVDQLTNEVSTIKPTVVTFNNDRHQAIGSKKTIALIWSLIVSAISGLTVIIIEILHQFWPGGTPPHHP